ncbi:hypothetical protein J6590_044592 [Homalodisca vitripennis]|nr:hypothetical protein J6590_044592 [Homalodisca vitripennis]
MKNKVKYHIIRRQEFLPKSQEFSDVRQRRPRAVSFLPSTELKYALGTERLKHCSQSVMVVKRTHYRSTSRLKFMVQQWKLQVQTFSKRQKF